MKAGHSANLDSVRTTRKALLLIASMYVVIGFALAVYSIMRRDPLGAFLGFAIVIGTISAAVMLGYVLKLIVRSELLGRQVEELSGCLGRVEGLVSNQLEALEHRASTIRQVDLSGVGAGDPTLLAAATLDRAVYPRLVRTMEDEPPAASADSGAAPKPVTLRFTGAEQTSGLDRSTTGKAVPSESGNGSGEALTAESTPGAVPSLPATATSTSSVPAASNGQRFHPSGPTTKDLLAQWRAALQSDDLTACRGVYSALVDLTSPDQLAPLAEQMEMLGDRVERRLREQFVRCVRDREYAEALAAGDELSRLLVGRPVVDEFRRLRPRLVERLSVELDQDARTLAR